MGELVHPIKRTYYVANNADGKIIHYGFTEPNQVTTTGQPQFNCYIKIADCEKRLKVDLKVTAEQLIAQPIDEKTIPDIITK